MRTQDGREFEIREGSPGTWQLEWLVLLLLAGLAWPLDRIRAARSATVPA